MAGKLLLVYICNLHALSNLLLIYIYKLHWNPLSIPPPLVRKFAVMSLCNISVHEANQERLSVLGSLPPLIHLLNDSEEVVARFAAMTITNLATEGRNQVYIVKLGALQKLIKLASTQDTEASRYAGMERDYLLYIIFF